MANKVTRITMREGTLQEWDSAPGAYLNPGEIGVETDTYRLKIGRQEKDTYSGIPYFAAGIVSIGDGLDLGSTGELTADLDGISFDTVEIGQRLDSIDTVLDEFEKKIDQNEVEIDHLQIDQVRQDLEIAENTQRLETVDGALDALDVRVDALELDNTVIKQDIVDNTSEIVDIKLDIVEITGKIDTISPAIDDIIARLDTVEAEIILKADLNDVLDSSPTYADFVTNLKVLLT